MTFAARKAQKSKAKARVALDGPSGSGKTYGAILLASGIGGKIAVIDTENASADLYADIAEYDVVPFDPPYSPDRYCEAIAYCEQAGYDIIIIDSISHEWNGAGGCLEIQSGLGGRFQDWAKVTPRHQKFIDAILRSACHVLVTCRTKTAYEVDEKSRKVQKVGTAPQQREGLDFEMTVVFDLTQQHYAVASKDRTRLFDGREEIITAETGKRLAAWLNDGDAAPTPKVEKPKEKPQSNTKAIKDELSKQGKALKAIDPQRASEIMVRHAGDYEAMLAAVNAALDEIEAEHDNAMRNEGEGEA